MTDGFVAAAVDLGASGGRVVLGRLGADRLDAEVVHRFPNEPIRGEDGRLVWDIDALFASVVEGLAKAVATAGGVDSIGVDTWAVDYGLLDADGRLIGPPVHYRDDRTTGVMDRARERIGDERLYETTGLQFLPFNTLYQLLAEDPARLAAADGLLLMPDLIVHHLTGAVGAERTNASTTQAYDVVRGDWARDMVSDLGLPTGLLPGIHDPGTDRGRLSAAIAERIGDDGRARVRAVGSHDTASAVAAVPAHDDRFGYISCGTWSLVGVELAAPVLTRDSREANFTNEVGIDGTIRYLRNVTGLWPLQECLRTWADDGTPVDLGTLLAAAAEEPPLRSVFDAESPDLLAPGGMPARIARLCERAGHPAPRTPPQVARAVLDSLAIGHARAIRDASRLSGQPVDVVHLVGGGARNRLLAQLTADACGLPVIAGPVEATALGNLLVQARAAGVLDGHAAARALVARTQPLERYEPRADVAWPV